MYLSYFEEPAYDKLRQDIPDNIEHYTIDDVSWLDTYFNGLPYFSTSKIVTVESVDLYSQNEKKLTDEEKNIQDLANIKILYKAFEKLTPIQATEKLLWSYLAHTQFKGYVVSRWIVNPDPENDRIQKTIKERFFGESQKTLIRMNAISRLWWAGYLTYDKDNSINPWHLTEILLTGQQVWSDIFDTPFCGNKKIIKGFLLGIKKYQEEKKITANLIRECVKYFRRYAAVTNVDFLDEAEITAIVYEFLAKS